MPDRIGREGRLGRRLIVAVVTGVLLAGLPGVAAGADPDPAAERAAHMRAIVEKMRATDHTHPDGSTHEHSGGMAALSAADLRFLGVRRGSGVCAGMYEVADATVGHACTHGLDAMEPVAAAAAAKPAAGGSATATTPEAVALAATCDPTFDPDACPKPPGWTTPRQIPCYSSGPYVEVMYLYWGTSRFATFSERIRRSIAWADLMYKVSAGAVKNASGIAGNRHVHWAMATGCKLKITTVQLPSSTPDDIGSIKSRLEATGKIVSTTKYIAYVDDGDGCYGGIAELQNDSRAVSTNRSNYGGSFGMLNAACTGSYDFGSIVASHELTHTLGAVQFDAPHTTGGHCWDDIATPGDGADIMCYDDGGVPTSKFYLRCPITVPETFDCGKDDYFNPYPNAGNYLYSHWNTASNKFLSTAEPPAWDTIPVLSVALPGNGSKIGGIATIGATVTAPAGLTVDHVNFRVAGGDVIEDADAPYEVEVDTYSIPDLAAVKVDATGYDQYGMPSQTVSGTFTVVNPQVHLDAPAVNLISSPKVAWAATAAAYGGRTITKVELLVFGEVVATDTTKPYGGLINMNAISGFTEGTDYLEVNARVTDSAGIIGESRVRPIWIGTAAARVASLGGAPVRAGVPTRLQAAVTPPIGVDIASVEFLVNGGPVGGGPDLTAPYAVDWTPALTGARNLTIRVIDKAGFVWVSQPDPFDVIATDASVAIDDPADGTVTDGALTVGGSAVPPSGGAVDSLAAVLDTGLLQDLPTDGGSALIGIGDQGFGDHFVRIQAQGFTPDYWTLGSTTRRITLDGPDIAITGPTEGAVVRQTVTVGATVTDLDAATVSYVQFYQGEQWLGVDTTAPYEVSWNTLDEPDGVARLTARVTTSNADVVSPVRTVTKRNLRAWFTSPLPNVVVSGPVAFKAGGKCDTDCVLENATIRVDGAPVKYDNTAPYWFTWDSTKVADGPHTYSVTFSTSDARAVSTINFPFVVDNTP